jgi:hypothetical protein
MELGSVTLKRIGFFCFPIKHSTHTHTNKHMSSTTTIPLPPREQLYNRYCSNKHIHRLPGRETLRDSGLRITAGGPGPTPGRPSF